MTYKDKFDFLIGESQFPVAILGNLATADFELVDLLAPLPEDINTRMRERGLYFLGNVGLINGAPQSALDEPLDDAAISVLAMSYIAHIETQLNARLEVSEMTRLYGLRDTRLN